MRGEIRSDIRVLALRPIELLSDDAACVRSLRETAAHLCKKWRLHARVIERRPVDILAVLAARRYRELADEFEELVKPLADRPEVFSNLLQRCIGLAARWQTCSAALERGALTAESVHRQVSSFAPQGHELFLARTDAATYQVVAAEALAALLFVVPV